MDEQLTFECAFTDWLSAISLQWLRTFRTNSTALQYSLEIKISVPSVSRLTSYMCKIL